MYVEKVHFLTWALHLHFLSDKWVSLNWGDIYQKINTEWKRILKVSQLRMHETSQIGFFLIPEEHWNHCYFPSLCLLYKLESTSNYGSQ